MSRIELTLGNRTVVAAVEGNRIRIDNQTFTVESVGHGFYRVTDGTEQWAVAVAGANDERWIFVDGQVSRIGVPPAAVKPEERRRKSTHDLSSPMPATVVRVLVEPGTRVSRGASLIVLEAMKMELPIRAPRDGVVRAVHCKPGELVQPGVNLLDLE